MRPAWVFVAALVMALVVALFPTPATAGPYFDNDDALQDDYSENTIDNFSQYAPQKRSCVRRGGSCDHRPSECCYNGSCRCNLWGTNCRCQRGGLFQKWG